jgi:hypothetical protein
MLKHALHYLKTGFVPIPVKTRTKDKPLIKWKQYQTRRPTEAEVKSWWTQWPKANIALVTGKVSGLVVFDSDGPEAERIISENGGVPEGPQSITARGRQYFSKHPGFEVHNNANSKLTLDIRGDGGFVLVPPSVHPSGKEYQWAPDLSLFDVDLPELRPWQLEYIKTHCGGPQNPQRQQTEALQGVSEGERNTTATKLAGRYIAKGLSDNEVTSILLTWNQANRPPLPDDEILKTIQSVRATHGRNHPENKEPKGRTLAELKKRFSAQVSWVWREHLPKGLPVIVNGREGTGKTTILIQAGKEILENHPQGSVVWLASEGRVADTVSKMEELGVSERFIVGEKSDGAFKWDFTTRRDLKELERLLESLEQPILCVFIDSLRGITSFDENESKMKNVIQSVNSVVCDTFKACLVYIHHWKKGGQNKDLLDKSSGSTAITSSVQLVLSVIPVTAFKRVIKEAKSNFLSGMRPELESIKLDDRIIIQQTSGQSEERLSVQAEKFLLELFDESPRILAREIFDKGERLGFSDSLLKKIKKTLGIESVRDNFDDPWSWELPLETQNESVKGNRVPREKLKNQSVQVPENTARDTRDTRERGNVHQGTRDTRDTRNTLNIGSISSNNNNKNNKLNPPSGDSPRGMPEMYQKPGVLADHLKGLWDEPEKI